MQPCTQTTYSFKDGQGNLRHGLSLLVETRFNVNFKNELEFYFYVILFAQLYAAAFFF